MCLCVKSKAGSQFLKPAKLVYDTETRITTLEDGVILLLKQLAIHDCLAFNTPMADLCERDRQAYGQLATAIELISASWSQSLFYKAWSFDR